MQIEVAGLSDVGVRRRARSNEDSFTIAQFDNGGVVLAVADGIGGAPHGAEASALAIGAVNAFSAGSDPADSLRLTVARANDAVWQFQRSRADRHGAGTTLVAAYLKEGRFWVANVGDSRAYLVRAGRIEQLTEDHSLVQAAIRAGEMTTEQARHDARSHIITRSVGGEQAVEADVVNGDLREGDVLLLCTDGLTVPLTDGEILHIVETVEGRPTTAARALIEAAKAAGGPDNVTVVIAKMSDNDVGGTAAAP